MRNVAVGYILWLFFGVLGAHRFYCGRIGTGILWALTGGLFGIGWLIDVFLIPGMVEDANREAFLAHDEAAYGPPAASAGRQAFATPPAYQGNPTSDARVIYCTQCGAAMRVPPQSTGAPYACPACQAVMRVPA